MTGPGGGDQRLSNAGLARKVAMKHSARLTKPFLGIRENFLKSKSGSVRGSRIP
jgi:hypothetical protein